MGTINEYLEANSLENLTNLETYEMPFKKYRPLDQGNSKLSDTIFSFSLIPVVTCGRRCKGCYDIGDLRYPSVQEKRKYNTWLSIHNLAGLKAMIIAQILASKKMEFVRIHVGGDFYSFEYTNMWTEIATEIGALRPEIVFFTFTKTKFTEILQMANINVVASNVKGLGMNYGKREILELFVKNNPEYTLCPATIRAEDQKAERKLDKSIKVKDQDHTKICGVTCHACMKKAEVLFIIH